MGMCTSCQQICRKCPIRTETVPKWKLDKLEEAASSALLKISELIRHDVYGRNHEGHYLEQDELYQRLLGAAASLSTGLKEGFED